MVATLKDELRKVSKAPLSEDVISKYPSQIICLINEIEFETNCVKELEGRTLQRFSDQKNKFLSQLTSLCH